MDLILRRARLPQAGPSDPPVDIAVRDGVIAAVAPGLVADQKVAEGTVLDLDGRLVCGGLVEPHIHLDKARVLERTPPEPGRLADAIRRSTVAKRSFTEDDVRARAGAVLAAAVRSGTTRMRTQVELDPGVGLRGLAGVRAAIRDWAWAIDVQICVFPEEGLTNNPGTDELLVAALEQGGITAVGAAPGSDTDPAAQVRRVFELATRYDVDADLHLDFGNSPEGMLLGLVCDLADRHGLGGRTTVAHVTKLTTLPLAAQRAALRRMAEAGVALAVLPATDLYLMGRDRTHEVRRGVVDANLARAEGVLAVLGTNNVLNGFTPFGDCSLLRLANLYAHVAQVGADQQIRACFEMISGDAARLLRLADYGIVPGHPADLVVFDAASPEQAIREVRQPVLAFRRGRQTLRWPTPDLMPP